MHRAELFPETAVLFLTSAAVSRLPNSAGLFTATHPGDGLDMALRLQPEIQHVVVVAGVSPFDQWYLREAREQFASFEHRVTFTYLIGLPLADLLQQVSRLPAHSILFYLGVSQDRDGRVFLPFDVLASVSAVANVPTYMTRSDAMGQGVVGGVIEAGDVIATGLTDLALRVLGGERPDTIPLRETDTRIIFDWRQLQRWNIDKSRLPAGSTILFEPPGIWALYRGYVLAGVFVVLLQSVLIAGLVVQRGRRRRTEVALRKSEQQYRAAARQNQDLAGRLITAQDAERTRIARDLHDDVSQQVAALSIAFSGVKQRLGEYHVSGDLEQALADLQQQTLALARNIRRLSHDLHPTVLEHLGLVQGITSYCGELERAHGVAMRCSAQGDFASVSPEAAICVYRVAQEALRNVIAHAGASSAEVRLTLAGEYVEMTITDDGRGFDGATAGSRTGLGLISMIERAKIAGGTVTIVTGAAQGTRVELRIPAQEPAKRSLGQATEGQVAVTR
jgi:signal transduction histidine kinase